MVSGKKFNCDLDAFLALDVKRREHFAEAENISKKLVLKSFEGGYKVMIVSRALIIIHYSYLIRRIKSTQRCFYI